MKIAFVGKGGSGKSTTTSLFIQHLINKNKKVLAVDADINMHISQLMGISRNPDLALSEPENVVKIRQYLKGSNEFIKNASQVVKTTPPGSGSSLIYINDDDSIIKNYSTRFGENNFYMFVGTYDTDEIGVACYHTNLAIFENVLSHLVLQKNEWLVADMVAGTDAFSNTLHAQFDVIVLVIEPTPEGISVYEQYMTLAKEAEVDKNLYVVGNKIEDESDLEYLKEKLGNKLLGGLSLKKEIKQARQKDKPLSLSMLPSSEIALFDKIVKIADDKGENRQKKLKLLHDLHRKYAAQDYIVKEHGDLIGQIDVTFVYPEK